MRALALVCALATATAAVGPAVAARADGPWVLVVSGIGGSPEHREFFVQLSLEFLDAATERWSVPAERVRYLAGRTELAPERIHARSTRENVASAFEWLASESSPGDPVLVLLIGHGSARGGVSSLNLPGPDMAAGDFEPLLAGLEGRPLAFVNTTSSSSGFLSLAAPGRTIVTATRSSREQQETLFPRFWVDAFTSGAADTDKDGRISVLEAFVYANTEVARHYESEGLVRTEHALLDDDGDGDGSSEPGPDAADGDLARRVALGGVVVPTDPETADPALAGLIAERERLQGQLDELRSQEEFMEEDEYLDRLEALLLEIADVDARIREAGGEGT